jgi:tetratricopeptide (TPR) repeat protein
MQRLGEVFGRRIKGKWKVLLTDACHSGAISPEASATINRGLIDLDKSVFVLSASRDREQSFESPDWGGGHGVFTYFVERGLGGSADENRDGIVTADELGEYVRTNVRRDTQNQQTPNSERGSYDPQMLLAYVRANAAPDPPAAPKYGVMVIEANMDGVEVFIDGKSVGVVNKGKALRQQGMVPGAHTIQGVRMGYEPDGPREETVYPGQETTVTIKILRLRKRPQAAIDQLHRGMQFYAQGYAENYRKAADALEKALQSDPTYSQAALYLGRAYHALNEQERAAKYFQRAIETDPDYLEARWSYAGVLLDTGAVDEAIRQLNAVVQRDKQQGNAYYLLAEAYREKEAYPQAIEAAQNAVRLIPTKAEAHFWLAEGLRMNGQLEKAATSYADYLRLSDFDSKLAGQLNYWVLGFLVGHGRKSRAGQRDIWKDLRSLAYFGLCDCARQLGRYDEAVAYCQKSLAYDPKDPYIHYALGLTYAQKAQKTKSLETLAAASKYFRSMLVINPDMNEASDVRKMLNNFDQLLRTN